MKKLNKKQQKQFELMFNFLNEKTTNWLHIDESIVVPGDCIRNIYSSNYETFIITEKIGRGTITHSKLSPEQLEEIYYECLNDVDFQKFVESNK